MSEFEVLQDGSAFTTLDVSMCTKVVQFYHHQTTFDKLGPQLYGTDFLFRREQGVDPQVEVENPTVAI